MSCTVGRKSRTGSRGLEAVATSTASLLGSCGLFAGSGNGGLTSLPLANSSLSGRAGFESLVGNAGFESLPGNIGFASRLGIGGLVSLLGIVGLNSLPGNGGRGGPPPPNCNSFIRLGRLGCEVGIGSAGLKGLLSNNLSPSSSLKESSLLGRGGFPLAGGIPLPRMGNAGLLLRSGSSGSLGDTSALFTLLLGDCGHLGKNGF